MKTYLMLFMLWVIGINSFAQPVIVKDRDNDQPLDLVTFTSDSPKAFSLTNAHGEADIAKFNGAAVIEIRLIGYQTIRVSYADIEKAGFVILLAQTAINLDQVVISGSRWNQEQRDIPARIMVISARDVVLNNPQTTADLLASSGEVYIQKSQQGGGSPMIRGFATNRLLYTVDGIRMNTAIFRSGNLQNVISLDPFSFESAEVIFGPASLIYGSDAIAGVMSFRTLTPKYAVSGNQLVTGNALARYSSVNNEITGHFNVNIGWKKWAFITGFSSNNFGDLRMGSYGPEDYLRPWYVERADSADVVVMNDDPKVQKPTGYSQINLMQKISFKPGEKWEFQYGFHYSITTDYSRYDRLIRTRNGLPRSAEWYYGPQEWMMNNLTVTNIHSNTFYDQMVIRLAHQYFEESRHDRDFNKPMRYHRDEQVNAYSANLDFIKAVRQKHQFFYGFEMVLNDVNSSGTDEDITTAEEVNGPSRYPNSTWSSWAAYVSYQLKITEKFLIQTGARYNYNLLDADFSNNLAFYPLPFSTAELNQGALTGNVGLVYNPTEKWSVIMNLSTGFRAPNVDDMGKVFDSQQGSVTVPNPDLTPEYAYNGEIGIAKVFGEKVKIDFTGYYTYLNNAMVLRDYTLNGQDSIKYDGEMSKVKAIQNASFATVYGLQAGLEVKLPAGFGFTSQFNYQKGEEELEDGTKSPLRHAAPWFGISHLTFRASRLEIDLYATYNGEISYDKLCEEERGKPYLYAKDENGNPYAPAWYTLNIKTLYQLTDNFSVSAGIENLTDRRYQPYSSGIAGPGRNFILAVKARF
jgi:hemoglobin/transferrin/lactoferrin receptor protein